MSNATLNRVRPRWISPLTKAELARLDATEGEQVADWIEANLVYGEGDSYGDPVRLREWQRDFLVRLYLRDAETGQRRYRRAVFGVAKANGKSGIAAWIGAYELCSGRQRSPHVIVGAASLKQANLVFGDLKAAITGSADHPSPLRPYVETYDLQVLLKGQPGVAERIAAEAGTNDGARATTFVADELHEWEGRTARVYMVVEGALAKRRDAFLLAVSTAGVMGSDSPLEALYDHGKRVAQGLAVDPTFLFCWYEPEDGLDLEDPAQLERAIRQANPAVGDFLDIEALRHRFQTMPRFEFLRYHLNGWTSAKNRWIPMEKWDACSGEAIIAERDRVYLGVDAASKHDNTAVATVRKDEDGVMHVRAKVFEAPADEVIDRHLVKAFVREACKTYDVAQVVYDPAYFSESAQDLVEEGWPLVEIAQTPANKMEFSMALFDAVMQGRVRHGGEPVLAEHAEGAVAQDRGNGWSLEKLKASRHIDALIAVAMAVQAAELDQNEEVSFEWV